MAGYGNSRAYLRVTSTRRRELSAGGNVRWFLFEIEAQLVIAADLHYVPTDRAELMIDQTIEVIQKLNALIRTYDN